MKAVIMAGGEGRRLRPVTGDTPKPLAPLLGRPVMEHILRLLAGQGFDTVCAALRYRAEEIMARFGDGSALGLSLQYRVEAEPLGTAGGVKNCANFTGNEDFLVISGDAACDFDLAALVRAHREAGAAATLALYRSAEPLPYGLAVTDGEGLVRAFVEKPGWPQVVTDLVNTGIYVLSPRAMALVPDGKPFDFAKDLFQLLLKQGGSCLVVRWTATGATSAAPWPITAAASTPWRAVSGSRRGTPLPRRPEFRGTLPRCRTARTPRRERTQGWNAPAGTARC